MKWLSFFFFTLACAAPADHVKRDGAPTATITTPPATIVGSSLSNIDTFQGIPFASPPTGPLRLQPPQSLTTGLGVVDATKTPQACPHFNIGSNVSNFPSGIMGQLVDTPLFQAIGNAGEDCLTINVVRPSGTTTSSNLPVLIYIYGGAFESGSTTSYSGSNLVAYSVQIGKPLIYVTLNYRVGGFGFLAGKEIKAAGASNLGLLDQRLGLEWVADNIEAFGGAPDKVTIWGTSAGSMSVCDHMAMYDGNNTYQGKPHFRGAIMNSGSIVPATPVDGPQGQAIYDAVVEEAGCATASSTLECLRGLDYTTFLNAANSVPAVSSYNSIAVSYLPRPDGRILTDSPEALIKAGKYAAVPFIVGDQEDEGTAFALFQANITTSAAVVDYFQEVLFPYSDSSLVSGLVNAYPDDMTFGSPFDTGVGNNWYPQFKRLAAIMGDVMFTLCRRSFLSASAAAHPDVPSWSYLSTYGYGTPILGTFHASDSLRLFNEANPDQVSAALQDYFYAFVYNLDPNPGSGYTEWPQWKTARKLLNFEATATTTLTDDFRQSQFEYLLEHGSDLKL